MECIFSIEHVTKRFPGVTALDDMSLSFEKGEIHALCGENGAGKSTLIKTMCGIYEPDSGNIVFKGKPIRFKSPMEAIQQGISVVHQEIRLAENLSVAENIYIGRPPKRAHCKLVDWKKLYRDARALLDSMNIDLSERVAVNSLSIAQKQIVEIAKALSYNAEVIIMDEPSATLTEKELDALFSIIYGLRKRKITVIYISHRLDEVFRIADRVSVLRDGRYVGTVSTAHANKQQLITMMVNRPIGDEYPKVIRPMGEERLRAHSLRRGQAVKDISFCVHSGEVLGLAGLVGAGRTEALRLIYGADDMEGGEVFLNGKPVHLRNPANAIENGIALVPEDRKAQGLILGMDVCANFSIAGISKFIRRGFINKSAERKACQTYVDTLEIKTPTIFKVVRELSGGNQQKVVLARWLLMNSDILLLDEPTRGIDVGAKTEIYNFLNELTAQGKAVILISSDLPELMGMSDRIVVISKGRSVGELAREEFNQDRIMEMCIS